MADSESTPQKRALTLLAGFEPNYELELIVPRSTFSIDVFWPAKERRSTALGPLRSHLEHRDVGVEYFADPPPRGKLASAYAKHAILSYDHHTKASPARQHVRPPALLVLSDGQPRTGLAAAAATQCERWLWRWAGFGPTEAFLVDLKRLPMPGEEAFELWQPYSLLSTRDGTVTASEIDALLANPRLVQSDKEALMETMSRLSKALADKRDDEGFVDFWERTQRERDAWLIERDRLLAERERAETERERAETEREQLRAGQIAMLRALAEIGELPVDEARMNALVESASTETITELATRLARGEPVPELAPGSD